MHAMDMVPVFPRQASVFASNLTLGTPVRTPTVQMTALARVSATLTLGNVLATRLQLSSLGQAVNSWIALLAAMLPMVNATGMMASAYVRWVTQAKSVSCLPAALLIPSTLQRPTGGLSGTNLVGLHVHKVSCCMHSSVDCATLSPASTPVAVLLGAKGIHTFTRSDIATMILGGTTHLIALGGLSASLITMSPGCIGAVSPCTASKWPSVAH